MEQIRIRGARTHNLKNINLDLPRNKLIVITGLSGSGKSSLAFDTLYAEGQRRYVESLSAYARQFLQLMEKPDVDLIEGLSPAISIEQKATSHNPRSTVGTVTEIHDYLRLLYARVGTPYCPVHGRKFTPAANEATQARMRLSMPSRVYKGSIAGIVTRNVTAPEPSRWISSASRAVPGTMRLGRLPTTRKMPLMTGSSMPASVTMPKNRMANTNMPATGAILVMPETMNFEVSMPKPPIRAAMMGMVINATSGDIFLVRMAANKMAMVHSPSRASMGLSPELFGARLVRDLRPFCGAPFIL